MAELPDGVGIICIPEREFNIIFQLSHVYNHLLHEGIGLRQVIDYYYLLKSNTNRTNDTNIQDTLWYLGLEIIAGAMMWVLKEVLGLEKRYLIAPEDERRGRFLLDEIMEGGNFGQYVTQKSQKTQKGYFTGAKWLSDETAVGRNILRLKRDARLLRYFPSECLWEPIFRLWHFGWRVVH